MNKESFSIVVQTLTPLWTGDATRECESVKVSSIIGSLRWWYGEVVRASGRWGCTNNKCSLDYKKFIGDLSNGKSIEETLDAQRICPVCKLFGCTGWAGKFKIVIGSDNDGGKITNLEIKSRINRKGKRKAEGLMFDEDKPLKANFYPLKEIKDEEWELLNTTINLIYEWGALGGRTAQGNGVVNILSNNLPKSRINVEHSQYPNLNDFFFLKFHLHFNKKISCLIKENSFWTNQGTSNASRNWGTVWNEYEFLPIAFHIRDTIRRIEKDNGIRHKIFGVRGKGSQIFVSHGYKINNRTVEFRIWGYDIDGNSSVTIKSIEDALRDDLRNKLFIEKGDFTVDLMLVEQLNGR